MNNTSSPFHPEERKIINRYPSCSQPVVSPDGTRFAYIDVLEWKN